LHVSANPSRDTGLDGCSYARGVLSVPAAARVACWLNAFVSGDASADAVISGLNAAGSAEFALPDGSAPLSAALLLGEMRRWGATRASLAMPVPGDLVGLGGPADFNADAIDAGQAVVVHGPDVGLVPVTSGRHERWRGAAAAPPTFLPDVPSADAALRTTVRETADRLADLDVAAWGPDVADALMNLRTGSNFMVPMWFASTRAAQTAVAALRILAVADAAERVDSGPLTAAEAAARRDALRPLAAAARQALVAACSEPDGR
jgi:hypothetical protein